MSGLIDSSRAPLRLAQRWICRGHAATVAVEITKHHTKRRAKDKHNRDPQGSVSLRGVFVHRGLSARLSRTSSSLAGGAVVSTTGSPVISVTTGCGELDAGF